MNVLVTHPTNRNNGAPYHKLPDGAYACEEGQLIWISVTGKDFADAYVEGIPQETPMITRVADGYTTRWIFQPSTYAGRAHYHIRCGNDSVTIEFDIAPAKDKLGKVAFYDLLDELETIAAGLPWGISPGRTRGALTKRSAVVAEPYVLESLLPELRRSLRLFVEDPLYRTKQEREVRRINMTRKTDVETLRKLAQKPQALIAWSAAKGSDNIALPVIKLDQSVTAITTDHPVTRYLSGLLIKLEKELRNVASYLERIQQGEEAGLANPPTRAYCEGLSEKLTPAIQMVRSALTSYPLAGVEHGPLNESAVQALFGHPASLRLHRIARKMLKVGLAPDREQNVFAGLRDTWELYEFLVLYRLAESIAYHLGQDWTWQVTRAPSLSFFSSAAEAGIIRLENKNAILELRTQQNFSAKKNAGREVGCYSLSGQRAPDFVLGLFNSKRELQSWLVLDAKYRTQKSAVRDSLSKLHIYRDGLHWNGMKPAGGFAIIPSLKPSTELYASEEYRQDYQFGVLVCPLRPEEDWIKPVSTWLDAELEKLSNPSFDSHSDVMRR